MLSNLASYLLGYAAEPNVPSPVVENDENDQENFRLTAIETEEDDWLIVEKADEVSKEDDEGRCLSLEESWFITPPPCFTSTGPVEVETSPLENLLIEHPSMSVYHQRGPAASALLGRRRSSPSPPQQPPSPAHQPTAPLRQHQHPNTVINAQQYIQLQLIASQKHQNAKLSQGLKRNQLERGNKVREVNGRKKRHCRKDKQKNHSGANNNRKCC